MDDSSKMEFKETFDALSDYYQQKQKMAPIALRMYFAALAEYSMVQVQDAIALHMRDPNSGRFYPKVADLVGHLEGGAITTDMVISAARLAKTPFGVQCAIQIGSWDLSSADAFQLKQRAQECIDLLPEWRAQSKTGDYTDHEVSVMISYGVSPGEPFREGLPRPPENKELESQYWLAVDKDKARKAAAEETQRVLALPSTLTPEEKADNKKAFDELMAGLVGSVTPEYRTNLIACKTCKVPFEEILETCTNPICGVER